MLREYVVFVLCCHVATATLIPIKEPTFRSLKKLFNFIEANFHDQYNILAVTGTFDEHTSSLLDWTLVNYQTTPTIVTNLERLFKNSSLQVPPANLIVVILRNADFMNDTLDGVLNHLFFRYQSYVFFVFTQETSTADWFFPSCAYIWEKRILNFFFVFYDGSLRVLSCNPFKRNKLDNFTEAASYKQMFYNKVKQMNGYVIHGGTVEDIPRAVYRNGQLYVSDKIPMISILRRMNATVKETFFPNYHYGKLNEEMIKGDLDCAFIMQFLHSFTEVNAGKKTQFSYPYNTDASVIILPRPKYMPTYLNIFFIFQNTLWISLIVTCVLVTLIIAFLDKVALEVATVTPKESSMFQTLRILINLPSTEIKKAIFSKKILFAFCIWLTFFFHALFHSSLTSTLIKPKRYNRIKTLKDLSESKYMIYMFSKQRVQRSSSWELLQNQYIFVNKTQIFNMIMDCNSKYGYGCNSLESAGILVHRSRNKCHKGLFYVLKEAIMPGHRAFIFPKNSPYLSTINEYLLLYKEFGLKDKKYGDLEVEKNLIPEKDAFVPNRPIKGVVLSLKHMQTCFYILCLGLMVSTLAFVGEILFDKYQKGADVMKEVKKKKKRIGHW